MADNEIPDDEPPEEPETPTRAQVVEIFGGQDGDFDEQTRATAAPLHWPSLGADEAEPEWIQLHQWVTLLQHRFRGMIRLPACWYRHNDLVEALSALRDHERASYADTAKPTAAVAWHTALRDIEARLRTWIAELRCGGDPDYHDPAVHTPAAPDLTSPADLTAWIAQDKAARHAAAVRAAVASVAPQHLNRREPPS